MAGSFRRARRGMALVCLLFALGPSRASATEKVHATREKIASDPIALFDGPQTTYAYPPLDTSAPRPTVVYLHGVHGLATNGCPYFRRGSRDFGWLVCPEANLRDGVGFSWSGSTWEKRAIVDRAETAVAMRYPRAVDTNAPSVLIGFSQGAYLALELLRARPGHYTGLLLMGADVAPSREELRRAGVLRVVFAAGEVDGARRPMEAAAKKLASEGLPSRFVSLGAVGHTYAPDRDGVLEEALRWLETALSS